MPTITGGSNDFSLSFFWLLPAAAMGTHTGTEFTITIEDAYGTYTTTFIGTGFAYTDGRPTAGTIAGMRINVTNSISSSTTTWTDFSVSAATFWLWLISKDIVNVDALFCGGDITFIGSEPSPSFIGYYGNDTFNMQSIRGGGGNCSGGYGDDTFNFANNITLYRYIDGGPGNDTLHIDGDYYGTTLYWPLLSNSIFGVNLRNMKNVENVVLAPGHNYEQIQLFGSTGVTVDGSALAGGNHFSVYVSLTSSACYRVLGGAGADTFSGSCGSDTFDGGASSDTADYRIATGPVTVDLGKVGAQLIGGGMETDTLISVENAIGSAYNDILTGNSAANVLNGGVGNDVLSGGDEHDTLTGGAGNDTLDGGSNVDTAVFAGNTAAYTITQGATGVFTISGTDGTDTLSNVEYAKFDDQTMRLLPGSGTTINWSADPSTYMAAIRDFDGNDLSAASGWKLIGTADVNGDGVSEHILVNRQNGRWAEVGTEADGKNYLSNYGWAGDTRVVGIYIDPLVTQGIVVKGGDEDSQRRFENDLNIENIHGVLGQADYNHDGLQEIYFSLTDGTAYLHAYMHADGNIQYANYQNEQQVKDYLTSNGFTSAAWAGWFPAAQSALAAVAG